MAESTRVVPVFTLNELKPHNNADSLSLVEIPDSMYVCVARTEDWKDRVGTKVAWCPPDALVDTRQPEFTFLSADAKYDAESNKDKLLGAYARIKAKRLRGILSFGLLVPAPEGLNDGDDAAEALGVLHYEQPMQGGKQQADKCAKAAPPGVYFKYDVEAFMKFGKDVFTEGEPVYITEKLHGQNWRAVYQGEMHVGSRTMWKHEYTPIESVNKDQLIENFGEEAGLAKYDEIVARLHSSKSHWWQGLDSNPGIQEFCKAFPGHCVYGEIVGTQGKFCYDTDKNNPFKVYVFDILTPYGQWVNVEDFLNYCERFQMAHVPIIERSWPMDFDAIQSMCEGKTTLGRHVREGIVIKPLLPKGDMTGLKLINPDYYAQ